MNSFLKKGHMQKLYEIGNKAKVGSLLDAVAIETENLELT